MIRKTLRSHLTPALAPYLNRAVDKYGAHIFVFYLMPKEWVMEGAKHRIT